MRGRILIRIALGALLALAAAGLALPSTAPLLHFVSRQDMVGWAPQPLGR